MMGGAEGEQTCERPEESSLTNGYGKGSPLELSTSNEETTCRKSEDGFVKHLDFKEDSIKLSNDDSGRHKHEDKDKDFDDEKVKVSSFLEMTSIKQDNGTPRESGSTEVVINGFRHSLDENANYTDEVLKLEKEVKRINHDVSEQSHKENHQRKTDCSQSWIKEEEEIEIKNKTKDNEHTAKLNTSSTSAPTGTESTENEVEEDVKKGMDLLCQVEANGTITCSETELKKEEADGNIVAEKDVEKMKNEVHKQKDGNHFKADNVKREKIIKEESEKRKEKHKHRKADAKESITHSEKSEMKKKHDKLKKREKRERDRELSQMLVEKVHKEKKECVDQDGDEDICAKKALKRKGERDEGLWLKTEDGTDGREKKIKTEDGTDGREKKIKREGMCSEDSNLLIKQEEKKKKHKRKREKEEESSETKKNKHKKTEDEEKKVEDKAWKWWEEGHYEDGVKWKFMEHKGPYFAPPYEPLPDNVQFYYKGKPVKLSPAAEEVATFYAKMLDHEYTTKDAFRNNFFHDWKQEMTPDEREVLKKLEHCDFSEIHKYFVEKNEARKALPKEEKKKLKEEADKLQQEYGFCNLDGHVEKIGNFKIEPPGLFRGRGNHPKMGMLKKRIMPEDVIINCAKDSKIPKAPEGHKWKEIRFDNTVTWLASWTENIQGSIKYVMLNPSSKLKGEKDWQKYEVARRLKDVVAHIRSQYQADWKNREMKTRQRAVALYFIDKLALRAGNEKEEGETADTVGCCSLRVEHITLHRELDGQEYVVEFDFLGKDSIRYYNKVPVEKPVFKNVQLFMKNKDPSDDLFDRLNTNILNKHLQDLMDGLTAKVFRTYNASITLQQQLKKLTEGEDNVAAKMLSYNRANRAVAILCNHQRALPKTFEKSMQTLQTKIEAKKDLVVEAKMEVKRAKADHKAMKDEKSKQTVEKKKKLLERLREQLKKLELQATDKEENKQIALGTSKLNYLDPRITVAWCKKFGVPIEKVYNKTQRDKFAWAIDMTDENFEF